MLSAVRAATYKVSMENKYAPDGRPIFANRPKNENKQATRTETL